MEVKQKECILQTFGYQFRLFFREVHYQENLVGLIACLSLNAPYGEHSFYTQAEAVPLSDIGSFINYLEDHINLLRINPSTKSPLFSTYRLNFQVQALEGDVSSDIGFSIRCVVNLKKPGMNLLPNYLGIESSVPLSHIREFIDSLTEALESFTRTQD
ncbi:MAG TPA: hypothetical protein V6D18_19750 [Thermosynechococcaceae cyanobacterium]